MITLMLDLLLENLAEVVEGALNSEIEVAADDLIRVLVLIFDYTGHIYKILLIKLITAQNKA
jgi:hypothetical protein